MKRILSLWLAALIMAVQPAQAVVMVGFGQSSAPSSETLTPDTVSPAWTKTGGQTDVVTLSDTDDGTYFSSSSTSAIINFYTPDVVGAGAIASVKMCIRAKVSDDTNLTLRLRLYNGLTFQSFLTDPITISGTSFSEFCSNTMATDPYTAAAWLASNLNTYRWNIYTSATSFTPDVVYVSKAWGVVNF